MNISPTRFYKIMNYPVPENKELFYYQQKIKNKKYQNKKTFSRKKKNPYLDHYIKKIKRWKWIYKSLPFIEQIYICNSLSFNAANKNSDIDLFFICKKNSLRRARLFSVIFFFIFGLKRSIKDSSGKFCLSFYITIDNQRLSGIRIPEDIYLPYRIAHLNILYTKKIGREQSIFQQNKWIKKFLPNISLQQNINIGLEEYSGSTLLKKILERIFSRNIREKTIRNIWKPIVIKKKNKLKKGKKYIIIQNNILKFYLDKREEINEHFYKKNK